MTAKRCGVTWRVPGERIQTRHLGRRSLAALAAGILLLAGGVDSASAQIGPSGTIVEFDYTLTNVSPSGFPPAVVYSTGVVENAGSSVELQSGALKKVEFLSNAWTLGPTGTETLNATVSDWRLATGPTVTGTAYVPGGASMTVSVEGGAQIRLPNGKFSIPTGLGRLGAQPPKGGKQVVHCQGSPRSCRGRINLAGGARNREIVIRLTNTNLSLRSVRHPPKRKHAAYSLTHGHFADGGSEYVVILNAARSSPRGSDLILTFA